jgi:cysteine desulfurase/selenocysteine lyase
MWKHHFPIFQHRPSWVYLDNAATTHKPKEVIDALVRFYAEDYATIHRAVYPESLAASDAYFVARQKVQHFIKAKSVEEIVFTRGTTSAINLLARSLAFTLSSGDEVAVSRLEHHSNLVPWQMACQHSGAHLKVIEPDTDGTLRWKEAIGPKTKIVAVAHMSNVTGQINPIREIAEWAHQHHALCVVDGAQAAPHIPIDVQQLGCDFYAFSGHKCYGPTGVGVLYGRHHLLDRLEPIEGGGDMIEQVFFDTTTYQKAPARFEAGTPPIASIIAFGHAIDFMESIGMSKIQQWGHMLAERAYQVLNNIPFCRILSPFPITSGPLLSFVIEGVHPFDLGTLLGAEQVAIRTGHLCAQPALRWFSLKEVCRLSIAIYNTLEDIEMFEKKLSKALVLLKRGVACYREGVGDSQNS